MKENQPKNSQTRSMPVQYSQVVEILARDPEVAPLVRRRKLLMNGRYFLRAQGLSEAEIKRKLAPQEKELEEMLELYRNNREEYLKKYQ